MSNASTTPSSSALETTGTPIPITYGFAWVTGKRHAYYTLQNTGSSWMDYSRAGIWLLGHGEWDGPIELWINDNLVLVGGGANAASFGAACTQPGYDIAENYGDTFHGQNWVMGIDKNGNGQFNPLVFNFHRGCDSTIGAGFTPRSNGPDQETDILWSLFPSALQPLNFSRIAYYTILRKQAIEFQANNHRDDPSQWTDIAPIVLCRSLRCRLFDDQGNQTGYAFTTNPIWHFIDLTLRRKILPDYGLDLNAGPDLLSSAIQNRFDWGPLFTAAQYCDEILSNSRRRFEGNYSFSQQTSLQACQEQILLNCRAFMTEYAGKIGVNIDMPRPSVFTFSRSHILPGSWQADDLSLHKGGNRYIATFRDLLVPQCSEIQSITVGSSPSRPLVTTKAPHPFEDGDRIAIGGTGTPYDGVQQVYSVPAVQNVGTSEEIDPTTFYLVEPGSQVPSSVGAVGGIGLLYSRFKERTPEFWHKTNMLARGAVGLGIPRQREKVKQTLDFATTTWDQASRLTCYERDRLLGIDQTPYVTPPSVKLRTSMFAKDVYGNMVCAVRPGDHVTIDSTASFTYQGEFEVLEPLTVAPPTVESSGTDGSIARKPSDSSGEIEFVLGPYNEAVMYDTSDPTQAGWPSVPGSDPGNSVNFTPIPLANGGTFVFFSGMLSGGTNFQLPSTGFPAANLLAWASPASSNVPGNDHSASAVLLCAATPSMALILQYCDWEYGAGSGLTWGGSVNYACLAWLSTDVLTTANGLSWLELTLLGGETIIFGNGVLADGSTITLPAGYTAAQCFAVAELHDGPTDGSNVAHMMGASVDAELGVHYNITDGSGNEWHGNASLLVFAWKNNIGTVVSQTIGGNPWIQIPLSNGTIFGAGCAKNMANGATLTLPTSAGDGSTLEILIGSSNGLPEANTAHAQGIGSCYLDAANIVHATFQDGSNDVWPGTVDIFALYCTPTSSAATLVGVLPSSVSVATGGSQQFSATVTNNANQNVSWAVDGIAGGNVTVGTVDATGNYTAPTAAGSHTITATSVADGTASGSATVAVWTGVNSGGGWTVNGS
jgi:hypothetical protein